MDPAADLCAFSRDILNQFSDRSIERLTGRPAMALPASFTREHLRENVEKEIAKDCLVIERAMLAHRKGARLAHADFDILFEQSKQIDRYFVQRIILPSVTIQLQFDVIEEIRRKRIRYVADFASDILPLLEETGSLEKSVARLYTADQFHGFVGELLFLSCVEVKKLAGSVMFLSPFNQAMADFIDEVVEAMEQARHDVAAAAAARFFTLPAPGGPNPARLSLIFAAPLP
jgi:hypothetical protein